MGAMICTACGTPLSPVAEGVMYVRCGHRPMSAITPPAVDILKAYERWSYRAGWADGFSGGRRSHYDAGFRAGFVTGREAGAVRVVLTLEQVLQAQLPDLLPPAPADDRTEVHLDACAKVGAARILLGLEEVLRDAVVDLLLPEARQVVTDRERVDRPDEPCREVCGSCVGCVRALAAAVTAGQRVTGEAR